MTDDIRRELDQMWARLEQLDNHGTRGVGIVQSQLSDVIKDLAKLESRLEQHDRQHERQREQEARERRTARRWQTSAAIAAIGAIDGPMIDVLFHLH